jgi:hypothetical protein
MLEFGVHHDVARLVPSDTTMAPARPLLL